MQKLQTTLLLAITLFLCAGCLARQVASDGRNFREVLLDMYADQVMDNLIRTRENQPFVQLAYRNLIVTDSQILKANLSNEYDPTNNKSILTATGLFSSLSSSIDKFIVGGSGSCDRTMQFQADPYTVKRDIFDYYQAFAWNPAWFVVSDQEPCFPVHIKKKCGNRWYWVPKEAGGIFLQLVLKTTFMRGQETVAPVYWDTVVAFVAPMYDQNGWAIQPPQFQPPRYDNGVLVAPPNHKGYKYIIGFCDKIPNDQGDLCVTTEYGCKIKVNLLPMGLEPYTAGAWRQAQRPARTETGEEVLPGTFVGILSVYSNTPLDVCALAGWPARIYLAEYPNLRGMKSAEAQQFDEAIEQFRKSCKQY